MALDWYVYKARHHELWELACAFDAIDAGAPFIVFSSDNPYSQQLDALVAAQYPER